MRHWLTLATCSAPRSRTYAFPQGPCTTPSTSLGKKGGGSRTVATLSSFYRLLMRVSGDDISDWDTAAAGHWDTAIAGSSALRAHILRALDVELAMSEELCMAHFLWDMEKFCDNIAVRKLLPQLDALHYPTALASMGLLVHRAPRVLGTGISLSNIIVGASRSIIAGCQQSVSWARALLHRMVENLGYVIPGSVCFEHVDDLSQVVTADCKYKLRDAGISIGRMVRDQAAELGIKLSGKSVLLPAGDADVEAIADKLQKEGVPIRTARVAEDLGVQCSAGRRRNTAALKKRIKNTAKKVDRLHHLMRKNGRAARLGQPGLGPKQSYGHQAQGASPSLLASMRRNFKRSARVGRAMGCTTTTIWWTYGRGADPAVRVPLEQIGVWHDLWVNADVALRKRIRRQWMRRLPALIKSDSRWNDAKGPMAATICTVHDMGWKPSSPSHWMVGDAMQACIGGASFSRAHILAKAQSDIEANLSRGAAEHQHGKGIGDDILLDGARRARRTLVRTGETAAALALDMIVVGAMRDPPQPGVDEQPRAEHLCHRCGGKARATRWHDLYACPDNAAVDHADEESKKFASNLIAEAAAGWDSESCLYARGITPSSWVGKRADVPFEGALVRATARLEEVLAETRYGFSDGAGGDDDIHPRHKVVTCGAATFTVDGDSGQLIVEGLTANVPGRQTVPRAEVWGAALI